VPALTATVEGMPNIATVAMPVCWWGRGTSAYAYSLDEAKNSTKR
jgi:hypothetical protein